MDKKVVFLLSIFLMSANIFGSGWHIAEEILPGTFSQGNFSFNGSVGIGTTNPARDLTLNSGSTDTHLLIQTDNSGSAINDGFDLVSYTDGSSAVWNYEEGELIFGTNNSRRITITDSGNVGIGTTTPSKKLDILGDTKVTGSLIVMRNQSNDFGAIYAQNYDNSSAAGTGYVWSLANASGSKFQAAKLIAKRGNNEFNHGILTFNLRTATNADSPVMTIVGSDTDSTANVGIGTTTPADRLHVSGGIVRFERIGKNISFNPNYGGLNQKATLELSSGMDFSLYQGSNENFFINGTSRKVGIGTTSPGAILEIKGNTLTNNVLDLTAKDGEQMLNFNTLSSHPFIEMFQDGGTNVTIKLDTNGDSYFTGGNVGIGTTDPGIRLLKLNKIPPGSILGS